MKSFIKKTIRAMRGDSDRATQLRTLTTTQELFCEWNAERLGLTQAESERRYRESWAALPGGHRGPSFREFCDTSYQVFKTFFDDNQREVFDTYQFHGRLHFLRMLSYRETALTANDPVLASLDSNPNPTILDFGCGLAAYSRSICLRLKERGASPRLVLADIPTARKDFLLWLGAKLGIQTQFLDCTPTRPIPDLPPCDACIVLDVFEHLHDPLAYLASLHDAIAPGGILVTNVKDQTAEFMHVSPSLETVRKRLKDLGYEERQPDRLFVKPGHH